MTLYIGLVGRCYLDMKAHDNRRDGITRLVGVCPTGVYADYKFQIGAPIVRLTLRTEAGEVDLPSFDAQGYTTVRDRTWKQFGFFTRVWPCGMDRVYRHIAMWSDRCETADCTVLVYQRSVALSTFAYDPTLVERFRDEGWTPAGEVAFLRPPPGHRLTAADMTWRGGPTPLPLCNQPEAEQQRTHE